MQRWATYLSHLVPTPWKVFTSVLTCMLNFNQHSTMIIMLSLNISSGNVQNILCRTLINQCYSKNGSLTWINQLTIFFGLWWWKTIIKEKIDSLVIIVGNGMILLPARNNTYSQDHERTLQASKSLLRVLSTFKINILYDNDDVIEGLRIKCINFNKVFGYE